MLKNIFGSDVPENELVGRHVGVQGIWPDGNFRIVEVLIDSVSESEYHGFICDNCGKATSRKVSLKKGSYDMIVLD